MNTIAKLRSILSGKLNVSEREFKQEAANFSYAVQFNYDSVIEDIARAGRVEELTVEITEDDMKNVFEEFDKLTKVESAWHKI